jgi:hypothetical protein
LDQLVGSDLQPRRNREIQCLSGLQVDYKLKLGWRMRRRLQASWLLARPRLHHRFDSEMIERLVQPRTGLAVDVLDNCPHELLSRHIGGRALAGKSFKECSHLAKTHPLYKQRYHCRRGNFDIRASRQQRCEGLQPPMSGRLKKR